MSWLRCFKNLGLVIVCCAVALKVVAQTDEELKSIEKDLSYFETPLAASLKTKTAGKAVKKIKNETLKQLAQQLAQKKYTQEYRVASYKAWLTPTLLGRQLMIGDGYSKYENITGIYLPEGKHLILADGVVADKNIKVIVPDWNRRAPEGIKPDKDPAGWGIKKQQFALKNGINVIEVKAPGGLAYIDYFSATPEKETPVKIHFVNAKVNGYFDITRHNDTHWNALIDNAVYPVIDAKGRHIQIAYPAEDCKKYAYGRGVELISNYDSLVYRQHRIMGLIKYNRVPENHVLARVNYNYYMFRDGDGVAYMGTNPGNAMAMVVNPDRVIKGDPCWGFSHEVGHVHQLRPYLNWGGLGEVSNNIFSLYVTKSYGNKSRASEQKNYQKAKDSIIARKICYLQDNDVFNRLIPFWQLQLFFEGPGKKPDFYPDLFEAFRLQGAAAGNENRGGRGGRNSNPAVYQLNFVSTACKVAQLDLTEFFDKYGFFYVGDIEFNDYGNYKYSLTQEMADACRAEIKAMNLPKPHMDISTMED